MIDVQKQTKPLTVSSDGEVQNFGHPDFRREGLDNGNIIRILAKRIKKNRRLLTIQERKVVSEESVKRFHVTKYQELERDNVALKTENTRLKRLLISEQHLQLDMLPEPVVPISPASILSRKDADEKQPPVPMISTAIAESEEILGTGFDEEAGGFFYFSKDAQLSFDHVNNDED